VFLVNVYAKRLIPRLVRRKLYGSESLSDEIRQNRMLPIIAHYTRPNLKTESTLTSISSNQPVHTYLAVIFVAYKDELTLNTFFGGGEAKVGPHSI
jgi:hypothetical protein